jgi:hypothetical protein
MSVEARCHCGSVRLVIEEQPSEVFLCSCSLCSRRGMLWARYKDREVGVQGYTEPYSFGEKSICFCHCPKCGCTTHWQSLRVGGDVGVNVRLIDGFEQTGGEDVRYSFGGAPVRVQMLEDANG